MTRDELMKDIMSDPGNQLFGLPLSQIQRMIHEYKEKGVDPYQIMHLESRNRELAAQVEQLETDLERYRGSYR